MVREKFNDALRKHVVDIMTIRAYLTVARQSSRISKPKRMTKAGFPTGPNGTLLMRPDRARSASPTGLLQIKGLPTAAAASL